MNNMGMETSSGGVEGGGWLNRFRKKTKKETPKNPQEGLDKVIKEKIERPPGSEVEDDEDKAREVQRKAFKSSQEQAPIPVNLSTEGVDKELEEARHVEALIKSGEPVFLRANDKARVGQYEQAKIIDVLGNNVVLELVDSGEQTFRSKKDLVKQNQEGESRNTPEVRIDPEAMEQSRLKDMALGAAKASMDEGFKSTAFSEKTGQYHKGEVRKIDKEAGEIYIAVKTDDGGGLVSEQIIKAPAVEWMAWQHHAGEEVEQ
jgi:hypothetical protein